MLSISSQQSVPALQASWPDADAHDMARLAAGHDGALNELMERHGTKLFHFLIRSLLDEEDAADLAQETFVKVYQNCTKFDARRKFSTWLYAIAANLVRDRFRWRSRHPRVSLDAENDTTGNRFQDNFAETRPSPSDCALADERAEAVRRALAELPDEMRLPLILSEYEERSHAEIGEILGCSPKAVEMRLYHARRHLRARLAALLESP